MKSGSVLVLLILTFATSVRADIVEVYNVGSPFDSGLAGLNPGSQISLDNEFDTSPLTGDVEARNPRSILAGGGDVLFTANAGGSTELHFDMGSGIEVTSLPGHTLSASQVLMSGIEADANTLDANFHFLFTAQYVDGSQVTNLSNLQLTATLGTLILSDFDGGLFQAELAGNTGLSDISISASSGGILRAVQFRSIVPDFDSDELRVRGSRTLVSAIPEPGSLAFLGFMASIAALRRRKSA